MDRYCPFIVLFISATILAAGTTDCMEIRGDVFSVNDGASYAWSPQNFAGFYYDIDDDLGCEQIEMSITDNRLEEPWGVRYSTSKQEREFEFEDWGCYYSIGFLGEDYFAGYSDLEVKVGEIPRLYDVSEDRNTLVDEQLLKVLYDDDAEMTLTSGQPLQLKDGYEVKIKAIDIDGNKVFVELTKDGQPITEKVVQPSKDGATMADKTFHYKKTIGDTKDIVVIAVHFKNAFGSAGQDFVTIDGVFQVSDTATEVEVDTQFDKMRICTVSSDGISMDNKDNAITLSGNKDISLMAGIHIKTADQDEGSADNPLRFYIYKEISDPGTYRLRGQVQVVVDGASFMWYPQNFAGLYYDIDDDLGNEQIEMSISGNKLEEPKGVVYTASKQLKDFEYEDWGYYYAMSFLGNSYFAGFSDQTNFDLMPTLPDTWSRGILAKVLIDDDEGRVLEGGEILPLEDDYSAVLTPGMDGKGLLLELFKGGSVIDRAALNPPCTYTYLGDLGSIRDVPLVVLGLKAPIMVDDQLYCKVEGIWQISDEPIILKMDDQFGALRVAMISDDGIVMDNADNAITLSKNKDITLMDDIHIKTADQDYISADNPLRFYIYKEISVSEVGGE